MTKAIETKEIVKPDKLESNQVFVENRGVFGIYPTKLCYFLDTNKHPNGGYYNGAALIKQAGFDNILRCDDGLEVLQKLLAAIFDLPLEKIDFIYDLTTQNLHDILRISNEVNGIKESDFLKGILTEKEMIEELA
jgi:hypothetical protein